MHKSRVIALVVASIVSTASFSSAQSATQGSRASARAERAAAPRRGHSSLLRGMKLSAAEKARVKEVRGSFHTQAMALRESLKPAMQEAKAARQRGDTAAVRAVMTRTKGDRETLRALRERQKTDLRAALSPENQKQLDANLLQASQRRGARAQKGRGTQGQHHRGRGNRIPNV